MKDLFTRPVGALALWQSIACVAGLGCIEPTRTVIDAQVSNDVGSDVTPDVAPDVETPDVTPDVAPDVETPDVAPDVAPDVDPGECVVDEDCDALSGSSACTEWTCVAQRCKLTNKDDGLDCSDDNACTGGDICQGGECQPGTDVLDCTHLGRSTQCTVVGCDPVDGCFQNHKPQGTTCIVVGGIPAENCVATGLVPPDTCDGQGACVDIPIGGPGTPNQAWLIDDWFFVYTDFESSATLRTTRAVLPMISPTDTAFNFVGTKAFGTSVFGGAVSGNLCADVAGKMTLQAGGGRLTGHHIYTQFAALRGESLRGTALLLRTSTNSPAEVNGTYNYVQTSLVAGAARPTTWRGSITFNQGCVVGGSISTHPGSSDGYAFQTSDSPCFLASTGVTGESSLVTLSVNALSQSGDGTSKTFRFRGAIGLNGDMLLLTTENATSGTTAPLPNYGVVLLMRNTSRGAFDPNELIGTWNYLFSGRKPGGEGEDGRLDFGTVKWNTAGEVVPGQITSFGPVTHVPQGWYVLDEERRQISQRVDLDSAFYQSGFLAPSNRLIVGWSVAAPSSPDTPAVFESDIPAAGSLLFMLKP